MLEQCQSGGQGAGAAELKAFQVDEGFDGGAAVVFATCHSKAKAAGASELGIGYMEVDSCRRVPDLDAYAPGPVPPLILLDRGWWFECSACCEPVRGMDGPEHKQPCVGDGQVYCSAKCRAVDLADERRREAANCALVEIVATRYPDATNLRTRVAANHLEGEQAVHGASWASFRLPGLLHPVAYQFGQEELLVSEQDSPAFISLYGGKNKN